MDKKETDKVIESVENTPVVEIPMDAPRSSFFGKYFAKPLSYFIFIVWTIITVLPLFWMGYSSFKTNEELTKNIYSWPHDVLDSKHSDFDIVE